MQNDGGWAKQQLAEIGISLVGTEQQQMIYRAVMQLLDVLQQQTHSDQTRTKTLDLFNDLARSKSVIPVPDPGMWVELSHGMFRKGNKVRVKSDAFTGEAGRIHNGREGVIVDARRGDVIVDIRDNRTPEISGFHYRPTHLEGWLH